jgi:predicted RNase H-like HicB family nuclease
MAKARPNFSINLSAIAYCEDGVWLAHCLELDIVSEGKDTDDALRSLMSLCELQITVAVEEGDIESIFRPAPPEIWKLYAIGKEFPMEETNQSAKASVVHRFESREMCFA